MGGRRIDGDGVGARRATGGLGPLERAGVLGKNLSEQLRNGEAMRALGTRLSKWRCPRMRPPTDATGRPTESRESPGAAECGAGWAVADAAGSPARP